MAKELTCPNCGPDYTLVPKANGDAVCPTCNGTFHPGPEPKVVAVGEYEELKGRVSKLETDNRELRERLGKPLGDPPQKTEEPAADDDEDEDV